MREELAERLLANVMGWNAEDIARERPLLQAFASLKYDSYHNFFPGMRFVESLAVWLNQFATRHERQLAYDFVRNRLVYLSDDEVSHLVSMAFPDFIRPKLLAKLSRETGRTLGELVSGPETVEYRALLRRSLFLGMSDGARIDTFRRLNRRISHEQVCPTYDAANNRAGELLEKLAADLGGEPAESSTATAPRFRVLVLLDDFSASGFTCSSKVTRILESLTSHTKPSSLFDLSDMEIVIIQFIATERALAVIRETVGGFLGPKGIRIPYTVDAIQSLPPSTSVDPMQTPGLQDLLLKYFDPKIVTSHFEKGRHERPYLGFDECALPVILAHNTPNDSLPILWFNEDHAHRGLFPRVDRHAAKA